MTKGYTYDFKTKEEMLNKLRNYSVAPDDDNILFKEKIKNELLHCPELLYSLNNNELENELFTEDGELNVDGEWDRYFGNNSNIRPYLFFPEIQTDVKHYLCYQIMFDSSPRENKILKYAHVIFTCFVDNKDGIDKYTGLPRHDLIMSIIREYFNWSNFFTSQCKIISDKEGSTDNNYITRTLILEGTVPNSLTKTTGTNTSYINYSVRK